MTARLLTGALLALGACIAIWRAARDGRQDAAIWMQVPAAVLLYFTLFPPLSSLRGDSLTVVTPDAASLPRPSLPGGQLAVALPGATAARAESVPDLATALRRFPDVSHLTVLGAGLPARDREVAAALSVKFMPSAEQGLVELRAPASALLGHEWAVRGRAAGRAVRVELHDPSGALVDADKLDAAGHFSLAAAMHGEGAIRFELRVLDAGQSVIDTASVPVIVHGGQGMALIVRAGAANPELKYWRRWASDAGLRLDVAERVTEGVVLRSGDTRLTPAALAQSDLVSIDARAWTALDASEKAALRSAVDQGLGLLLRADGPLDPQTVADWKDFGYGIGPAEGRTLTIDRQTGLRALTPFTAAPLHIDRAAVTPMLEADDGDILAGWRALGQGRVAVWLLVDSYKLVLLGETARYSSLWSDALDQVARPRAPARTQPVLPVDAWVDERAVLCGLDGSASVLTPTGESVPLVQDSAGCAGYWPGSPGWHTLRTASVQSPFYVRAADDGRGLRRTRDRDATAGIAGTAGTAARVAQVAALRAPMPRWPFFGAWLLATAVIWWRERRMP